MSYMGSTDAAILRLLLAGKEGDYNTLDAEAQCWKVCWRIQPSRNIVVPCSFLAHCRTVQDVQAVLDTEYAIVNVCSG